MPIFLRVKIKNHLEIVEQKKGSLVRAIAEAANFNQELIEKVNQKVYATLKDQLQVKLSGSGVRCLIDGGCASASEVVLFISPQNLDDKVIGEKNKVAGFVVGLMSKNTKVNLLEGMLMKKLPGKVGEALESTGVQHELEVKLVRMHNREDVEIGVAEMLQRSMESVSPTKISFDAARSVDCLFLNTTLFQLRLVSAALTYGAWPPTQSGPPQIIGAECSATWCTISNQMMTGVKGECVYIVEEPNVIESQKIKPKVLLRIKEKLTRFSGGGKILLKMSWYNPYAGVNLYEVKLEREDNMVDPNFVFSYQGGRGDNASIFYRLNYMEDEKEEKKRRESSPPAFNEKGGKGKNKDNGTANIQNQNPNPQNPQNPQNPSIPQSPENPPQIPSQFPSILSNPSTPPVGDEGMRARSSTTASISETASAAFSTLLSFAQYNTNSSASSLSTTPPSPSVFYTNPPPTVTTNTNTTINTPNNITPNNNINIPNNYNNYNNNNNNNNNPSTPPISNSNTSIPILPSNTISTPIASSNFQSISKTKPRSGSISQAQSN